jgi:uncharacterized protein (DUF58 family)
MSAQALSRRAARQTPDPMPVVARRETDLRQLELAVRHKLVGLMNGEHESPLAGNGTERAEGRPYRVGDDARRIDWCLTARSNELHVRDTVADRELETWFVFDATASLQFGTHTWEKRDLAMAAAAAFGLLGARPGNRTAAIAFDGTRISVVPPIAGRDGVMQLLRRLDRVWPGDTAPPAGAATIGLADGLRKLRQFAARRGRVVVVSDLIDTTPWPAELRALNARHDVVVCEVNDPREWALPAVGLITLVDPETGRRTEVQSDDATLRARFAAAAAQRRADTAVAVRRSGAWHLPMSTDGDWMMDIARFATRRTNANQTRGAVS